MSYDVIKNGVRYTSEEWAAEQKRTAQLRRANMENIIRHRQSPGGHAPYWGTGFVTQSAGVCAGQEAEHQKWIESNGIVGARVLPGGDVELSSPENKTKYLTARGLADYSSGGSGEMKGTGGSITKKSELENRNPLKKLNDPRTRMGQW